MGWLFGWNTKEAMVRELTTPPPNGSEILGHSVVGNNLWMLIRSGTHKNSDGTPLVFIVLFLMKHVRGAGGRDNDWGYKDMDESAGPYEYDCPLKFLRASTAADEASAEWRKHAVQWHADRAAHKKLWSKVKEGDVVEHVNDPKRRVVVTSPTAGKDWYTGRARYPGQFIGVLEGSAGLLRFARRLYKPATAKPHERTSDQQHPTTHT